MAAAGLGAQPVDQRLQMRKAAHAAEAMRGLLIIEKCECVGLAVAGLDAEMIEKCAADQMRRLAAHGADADIDARLAEIHRRELRMRVGHMQDAGIAEAADVVNRVSSAARRRAERRRKAPPPQEFR